MHPARGNVESCGDVVQHALEAGETGKLERQAVAQVGERALQPAMQVRGLGRQFCRPPNPAVARRFSGARKVPSSNVHATGCHTGSSTRQTR